jgi:hypothetical protein
MQWGKQWRLPTAEMDLCCSEHNTSAASRKRQPHVGSATSTVPVVAHYADQRGAHTTSGHRHLASAAQQCLLASSNASSPPLSNCIKQTILQVGVWGLGTSWNLVYLAVLVLLILSYLANFHLALRYPLMEQGKVRHLRMLKVCRLLCCTFLPMVPTAGLIDPVNYLRWLPFEDPVKFILAVNAVVRLTSCMLQLRWTCSCRLMDADDM